MLSTMHIESVGDHSRRKVRKQQNYVVHTLTFLPKAPSDRCVTQNGENGGQCWQRQECTFLPDKMELLRVHTVDDGTQLVHYSLPDRQPV